eukprot:g42569.t1
MFVFVSRCSSLPHLPGSKSLDGQAGGDSPRDLYENKNSKLSNLDISLNNIGPQGAKHIAEAIQENKTVIELRMELNKIGPAGAEAIANMLKVNLTLTALDFGRSGTGPQGAQSIADAIKVNSPLKILQLSWNGIGDEGVKHFAAALKTCCCSTLPLAATAASTAFKHFFSAEEKVRSKTMYSPGGVLVPLNEDYQEYFYRDAESPAKTQAKTKQAKTDKEEEAKVKSDKEEKVKEPSQPKPQQAKTGKEKDEKEAENAGGDSKREKVKDQQEKAEQDLYLELAHIITQAATGLWSLHESGVLHRDVDYLTLLQVLGDMV